MRFVLFFLIFFCMQVNGSQITRAFLYVLDKYVEEILNSNESETECIKQLKLYHSDLKIPKMWAAQMFDSSAKFQSGFITGNLYVVGNYDECLAIDVARNGSQIKGQYCRSIVSPNKKVSQCIERKLDEKNIRGLDQSSIYEMKFLTDLKYDACFPANCSISELQSLWNYAEKRFETNVHLTFYEQLCTTNEKLKVPKSDAIVMMAFGVIGLICLLSTLYDIFVFQRQTKKQFNLFMSFSYYTNGMRLLSLKDDKDDLKIKCLRGIRSITMAWIILSHSFLSNYVGTSINASYALDWMRHEENLFILGAFASVDSFFVISGCLIIYVMMLAKEQGRKINLPIFYFHRFIRITPSLAAMVLIYMYVFAHLGSGPYWNIVDYTLVQSCKSNWWSTLLFVQNYLHSTEACVLQSWYLAVDTQLYILSPLLFLPMLKWPKATITAIFLLLLVSIGITVQATYHHQINSASIEVQSKYYKYIYNATQVRMGAWLVGLLLGYVMFKTKNKTIRINKILVVLLWITSLTVMVFIMYLYIHFLKYKFTTAMIASFFSLSRVVWAICVSWVIFACARGFGGYINIFLSLPIFGITGRLTYSMYITHIAIMTVFEGQRATPAYVDNLIRFHSFWGDYAYCLMFSVIWTLTFESPITILEKSLFAKEKKQVNVPTNNYIENNVSFKSINQ